MAVANVHHHLAVLVPKTFHAPRTVSSRCPPPPSTRARADLLNETNVKYPELLRAPR